VPKAALDLMVVGTANLSVGLVSSSQITVADWQVQVSATTTPLQMDGTAYQYGSVVLQ
jgi:hypothetical protein